MAVKIKTLSKKPTKERICPICDKKKHMELAERYCSNQCRAQATEIDKFSLEFRVALVSNRR